MFQDLVRKLTIVVLNYRITSIKRPINKLEPRTRITKSGKEKNVTKRAGKERRVTKPEMGPDA